MKKQIGILALLGLLWSSCDNNDIQYTGDLVVSAYGVTEVDGKPIDNLHVGVFDINSEIYWYNYAIATERFDQGQVKFKDLNPGNYTVVLMENSNGHHKIVQVKVGKTTKLNLFR
ncbi:FimB/Mfa2 family fimbrial subunit [Flavobacterium sp. GCM10027622]|uniref:FimB/Mfa2 family fimbrial subunit n=1 Tax=unclassified Flavobacterium TaxID=196869 RepID=UPI00360F9B5B